VWEDFMKLYKLATSEVNYEVITLINRIVRNTEVYPKNKRETIRKYWAVIYLGMVAEENKENAPLGKRIKALGMYQLLIEDYSAENAANCSRKMKWPELDKLCKQRGF